MRVLIASGGTGGHIFPALCLADALAKIEHGIDISLAVSLKKAGKDILKGRDIRVYPISARPMPTGANIMRYLLFGFGLIGAIFSSIKILMNYKPDVVAGFGGYGSFPVIFSAKLMGIPTLIHEQNMAMGKANGVLSLFADRVAVSFAPREYSYKKKFVLTGNPVRDNLFNVPRKDAFSFFGLEDGPFTLLIMGGSQGSHAINKAAAESLSLFSDDDRRGLQVVHLAGEADCAWLKERYEREMVKARVFDFLEDMRYAYTVSDLVIARAGATTMAELAALGIASILIPYPYAAGHQTANAKMMESSGGCYLIEEKGLTPQGLYAAIMRLMKGRGLLKKMSADAARLGMPQAPAKLAGEVIRLGAK